MRKLVTTRFNKYFGFCFHLRAAIGFLMLGLVSIFFVSITDGFAASNWVSVTALVDSIVQSPITANDLKPPECASLDLVNIITGSGTFFGTISNDLILGSRFFDEVNGVEGADCILGGDENDYLINGSGVGSQNVLDRFEAVSYNNNNGTQAWAADWQELNELDGPVYGDVAVEVSMARGVFTPYTDQDTYVDERNPNRNYGNATELKVRGQTGDMNRSLFRFDLSSVPPGSHVLSAYVYFYTTHKINSPVYLHKVTGDWTETGATWNNIASAYDPTPIGSLIPIANFQIYTVDITGLVQQWVDGSLPNQGVMLIATPGAVESRFASREAPGLVQDPNISVDISQGGGTNTVYANKDTYLQESTPNANFGSSTELQVNPVPGNQKRALIGFDLSTIPPGSSVLSAKANFYNTQANSNPVLIHSITTDWTETGATWNNSPNIYDLNPIGSFIPASRNQYYSVDITTLVQQWMDGAIINRGIELIAASGAAETRYASREQAGNAQDPFLTFILAPGGSLQALRIQNSNKGAWRQVDLSTAWSAQINIDYLRQGLDDLND